MRTKKEMVIDKNELMKRLKETTTKSDFQRLQCLWIREIRPELTAEDVAEIVLLSKSSVWRIHAGALKNKELIYLEDKRGGRYRQNMSILEEENILKPFLKKAEESGIVEVSEIKKMYEAKIGHPVPKSTIYRMLERHNWRKIVPYKRNPKSDVEKQVEFKKNSRK